LHWSKTLVVALATKEGIRKVRIVWEKTTQLSADFPNTFFWIQVASSTTSLLNPLSLIICT